MASSNYCPPVTLEHHSQPVPSQGPNMYDYGIRVMTTLLEKHKHVLISSPHNDRAK